MKLVERKGNFYHLFVEDFGSHLKPKELNSEIASIEIPDRGGLLVVDDNCLPGITDKRGYGEDNTFVFQPVRTNSDSRLLMVCPGRKRPIINGIPAPPIALLNVRDDILFPNAFEFLAHVTLFIRPRLGPVPENRIGRKCPFCRSAFLKSSHTYTCYRCGQVIHYERVGHGESNALDCANICDDCPVCRAPIYLADGFVYLPEFMQQRGDCHSC